MEELILKSLSNLDAFEKIKLWTILQALFESPKRQCQFIVNKPPNAVLDIEYIFVLFIEVQLPYWIIFL